MVLEKTLERPLDSKEIKPVNPKGSQLWIFIWRTEAEAPILWPPVAKNWLTGKDPDAGQDWMQEEKGTRGWDGWMASPTQWTWVWASFGSWWWTGKPGLLQSMGSQWVGHNRETELHWTKPMAQRLKHLPTMRETGVWSLGQEDPLEKEMATHSSMLVWRIPWTEEPGGLQSMGSQWVRHDWAT